MDGQDGRDFQMRRNLDSGFRRNNEKGGRNDEKTKPPKLERYPSRIQS